MTRILLVDDDAIIQKIVCTVLRQNDYQIDVTKGEQQAIELFRQNIYDLVILDINLKYDSGGYRVCQEIKDDPYGAWIPVIFLSTLRGEKNIIKGFRKGADDYICKPFTAQELLACVKRNLTNKNKEHMKFLNLSEAQFEIEDIIEGKYGNYKIKREIQCGAMGVVFEGVEETLQKKFALKVVKLGSSSSKELVQRLLYEANTIIQLQHPHIAKGIEIVRSPENFFLVMEFIEGTNMGELIRLQTQINYTEAVIYLYHILQALETVDKHNLVHRDIKPDNIIVNNYKAVLVDFGLVKKQYTEKQFTPREITVGTPIYASPEQLFGKSLDIRSDIYSLGITFYHAITGCVPFVENGNFFHYRKLVEDPITPQSFEPKIPKELVDILQKMTKCNRKNRYQNPQQVLDELEAFIVR